MRKLLAPIIAALFYLSILSPVGAVNWTFQDNVTVQGNLTVVGSTTPADNSVDGTKILDNSVAPAKLEATGTPDNTTFLRGDGAWSVPSADLQSQIDAKQGLDADLTVLSYPENWRMFYSNGSHAVTEFAFDNTAGMCFKSGGASAAPTWGTCGTGSGDYDADNVAITGGAIDNTPIGSTTPAAGTFSELAVGVVDNTEIGYLDNASSNLQTQIDGKQALDNGTFTGEVTGSQFNSTGLDNTHYINVANTGAPNVGTETKGDCYYDNTTTAWLCWDGDSWEPPAFSTLSHGTNPTIDGEGEAGVDTTADQVVFYGTAERVLTYKKVENFTIYGYSASHDNVVEFELEDAATLTSFSCRTGSTDNVSVTLWECDANAANCSTTGLTAAATSTTATDSTPTNADIDAGDRIKVALTSIAGTPSKVSCVLRYTITRQ